MKDIMIKVLSVVMALTMIMGMFATIAYSTNDVFEISVAVSATEAKDGSVFAVPGDTFEVYVTIDNNPGAAYIQFTVKYDAEILKPVVDDNGAIVFESENNKNVYIYDVVNARNPGEIVFISHLDPDALPCEEIGALATLKFEVIKSAEGNTEIAVANARAFPSSFAGNKAFAVEAGSAVVNVHNFVEDATKYLACTGYRFYACECGATAEVEPNPDGHNLTTVEGTPATCTTPGFLAGERCTLCGKSSDKAIDPSKPAFGHDYQLVIEDPQCGIGGKIYDQCVRCGKTNGYSYVQDENGNNVYEIISSEFWTSDGQNQHTCERVGHSYSNYCYTLIQQPTCTENGVAKYGCPVEGCDAYVSVHVMAFGHKWAMTEYVAPDCEKDGFRTYVCDYCGAVADAANPELVADVNAWLRKEFHLKADEEIPTQIIAGIIPALGHDFTDISEECDCVVGFDLDGDGQKPFLGEAENVYQAPNCFSDGYQWQHCTNDGCHYGKSAVGGTTHATNKKVLSKNGACDWEKEGDKYVYTYTFYILDQATEKPVTGYVPYVVKATSLEAAKAEFTEAHKNTYGTFDELACRVLVNAVRSCTWCNNVVGVASEGYRPIAHSWIITNERPDANNPWCSENAINLGTKACERCGYTIENYRYVVAHLMALMCDDPYCTSTRALYDECDLEYDSVPWCDNCTHANRRYTCIECGEVSTAMGKIEHKWVKTEEKIPYFVHPDFGPVYETCMLPARYVYVCNNAFADGFECECTTWHYDTNDFSKLGGGIWNDIDGDGKLDLDEVDDNGVHISGEELSVGYGANGELTGRGDIDAIDRVYGHRPHATVDANGNTIVDATNSGITYKAPTCSTEGCIEGFCTWCSEYVKIYIPASAQYHDYVLTKAAIEATCMEVGNTEQRQCKYCHEIVGGEIIPYDYTNHVDGCVRHDTPSWIRPASCVFPYAETYVWSTCKYQEIVESKQVNPANHVVYQCSDDFTKYYVIDRVKTVLLAAPTCTVAGNHTFSFCLECFYVVDVSNADLENYSETLDSTMSSILSAMEAINSASTVADYGDIACGKYINGQHIAAYYAANYRLSEINGRATRIDTTETNKTNISDDIFAIAALGHDFYFDPKTTSVGGNVLRVYLKETCTTPGQEWAIGCTRGCVDVDGNPVLHPELNGETIAPHGLVAENLTRVDTEKAPTCTEGGLEAGLMCKLCDTEDDLDSTDAAVRAHAQECFVCIGATNTIPELGHNFTVSAIKRSNYACDYAVTFYRCTNCDYMIGTNFIPAEEHRFEVEKLDKDGNPVYKVYTQAPTCAEQGFTYLMCSVCGGREIIETIPAHGHQNQNTYIGLSCVNDEYLVYRGIGCEICGKKVAVEGRSVICGIQNANIEHNWVMTVVEGGCTSEGAVIYVCADCGVIKNDSVHNYVDGVCACGAVESEFVAPALGHDFGYTVEYVPATPQNSGLWTWVCSRCGEEITEEILYKGEIVDPEYEAKVIVESKTVKIGTEFTVAVSIENNPGLAYLRVLLDYDKSIFELTNITSTTDMAMEIGNNLISWDNSENYTGEELCVFTFTVIDDSAAVGDYNIDVTVIECYDEDTDDVHINSGSGTVTVIDYIYGDVNGDGEVNGKDVVVMRKHLVGDDVEIFGGADANGDGTVNSKDLIAIRKYLVGTATLGPQE